MNHGTCVFVCVWSTLGLGTAPSGMYLLLSKFIRNQLLMDPLLLGNRPQLSERKWTIIRLIGQARVSCTISPNNPGHDTHKN